MRKITQTIETLLKELPLLQLPLDASVTTAMELMTDQKNSCVLVTEQNKLRGIFTDRDFLRRVASQGLLPSKVKLCDVMTSDPDHLSPDDNIVYAIHLMSEGGFRNVPIVDADDRPHGILTAPRIVSHLNALYSSESDVDNEESVVREWDGWIDSGGG